MGRLEQWRQDFRIAARGLRRTPAFTFAAVITLALGVAGTTMMFALVRGVLVRPLPVRDQDALVVAWKEMRTTGFAHVPFYDPELDVLRGATQVFDAFGGADFRGAWRMVVTENGTATTLMVAPVTGEFFTVLGAEASLGRTLQPADDRIGAEPVIVLAHGAWQRRYGGSPEVVGRTMTLRSRSFRIVGVMPRGFEYPRGAEGWMPAAAVVATTRDARFFPLMDVVGRLRPGATPAQAAAELAGLVRRIEEQQQVYSFRGQTPVVQRLEDVVVGDVRTPILVLFAAVGLVLLIACANVANLLLMRGAARRSENAVRAALGAGRGRLARQALAESGVLAFWAGLAGFAAAWWGLKTMLAVLPAGLPRADDVRIDPGVAAFTAVAALAAAAIAGAAPALHTARTNLSEALRGGGRGPVGAASRRGRRVLVVAQVALAVMVVAAAGLLARSLFRLQSVELGHAGNDLVFVQLSLPPAEYASVERHSRFLDDLVARLEADGRIRGATTVNALPFGGSTGWDAPQFTAQGQDAERAASNPALNLEAVRPNYFDVFGIELVSGRAFAESDREDAPPVAIVSQDVAARVWPGIDPLGKRLKLGPPDSDDAWRTVVGVAASVRYRELAEARATLYMPARQFGVPVSTLALRTATDPATAAAIARDAVRTIDPDVAVLRVATFDELLQQPLSRPRFNALLLGVFAIAALLLAAVGLYAVVSAFVRQRTTEIGIRLALGATARDVRTLVLREGVTLALFGAAIGLAGAVAAARMLRSLLYDAQPLDFTSILAAGALLVLLAALASWLPARRAVKMDPISALRPE